MNLMTLLLVGVKAVRSTPGMYYGELIAAGFIVLMLLFIKSFSNNSKTENYV